MKLNSQFTIAYGSGTPRGGSTSTGMCIYRGDAVTDAKNWVFEAATGSMYISQYGDSTGAAGRMRIDARSTTNLADATPELTVADKKIGVMVASPRATFHSTGSTNLGCAPLDNGWNDIGNAQINISASGGALSFSWKHSDGTQRIIAFTAPAAGATRTI